MIVVLGSLATVGFASEAEYPWRAAGLTERQAAAHMLDRFSFGATPGEIDRVLAIGLEEWFESQLAGDAPDPALTERLNELPSAGMSVMEIAQTYPTGPRLRRMAENAGVLSEGMDRETMRDDPAVRQEFREFMERNGYRRMAELTRDLMTQKVVRALESENQLHEVLTDFWFNHFNVSLTDMDTRSYLLTYERDAIRPHVGGAFRDLLGATARSPAMLHYLDNAQSSADEGTRTTFRSGRGETRGGMGRGGAGGAGGRGGRGGAGTMGGRGSGGSGGSGVSGGSGGSGGPGPPGSFQSRNRSRPQRTRSMGINENYARELLELHTLGVEGGYTQEDVIAVARAFSGWTVVRPEMGSEGDRRLRQVRERGASAGFLIDGAFLFRADAHDAEKKEVLGNRLKAGRGIEDGEQVLDILTAHGATAVHIAEKLARRFVSDDPAPQLVDRLAQIFTKSGGDLSEVLRGLPESVEFWAPEARQQKIKSPFEVAISALRALDAEVASVAGVVDWVSRMGQPLYAYQAPTGYPDRAESWVNSGALLTRMNFGLDLAAGLVHGTKFDLASLDGEREPESADQALTSYLGLLLPERETGETREQLVPLLSDPEFADRLNKRSTSESDRSMPTMESSSRPFENPFPEYRRASSRGRADTSVLARVAGLILGSPEFQRR